MNGPPGGGDAVARARDMIMKIVSKHGDGGPPGGQPGYSGPPNNAPNGGGNSSGGGGGGGFGGGYQEIMIPGPKVGLVIGKGGETIKQLQEKTGAKMVIIQDGPGQELEKPLRISGDPQKVEHAKQLVFELIQEKEAGGFPSSGGGGGGGGNQRQFNSGGEQAEVFVPKVAVGVVIGKSGDMIKRIQGETGCKLQFIQGRNDAPGDRRCIIQGTKQQVDDGKRMIEELIENLAKRGNNENRGGNAGHPYPTSDYGVGQPSRDECSFTVPASKCGVSLVLHAYTFSKIIVKNLLSFYGYRYHKIFMFSVFVSFTAWRLQHFALISSSD